MGDRNQRKPDNVPDRLLIRRVALRRTETGAFEHQRSEHAVLQQDFVGIADNRLGNMPGDGVADVGIREALTAGVLGFLGKNIRDEAAPRCNQFFGAVRPNALHLVWKVRGCARYVCQ